MMRNCHRWTALVSAAVLSLAGPAQVYAEEVTQGGMTMDTAVIVPSSGLEDPQEAVVSVENAGGGSISPGTVNNYTGNDTQTGSVLPGTGSLPGTGNLPEAGSLPGTESLPGAESGADKKPDAPTDYSLGPGFFQNKEEEVKEPVQAPIETPAVAGDVLPIANPVQTLSSQPIRGIMAQDGTVALADVTNSIVQVADKYSYDQMILDMSLLKVRYGEKIHIREMGESLDNRKIYDCIIGNVHAPKHILIQGGIHAREYMNPLMMMQQMELILANYDTGTFHQMPLSEMFNYVAVHFVPMTNPDGITISQFGPEGIRSAQLREEINQCYAMDLARGKASLDTASYYSHWKANARGVDLNLNFDALWEEIGGGVPSSNGFRGLMPASEPETQAMVNLYNNPEYSWAAVLHYHSMGNVIYWDIRGNKVQAESLDLAQLMSRVTGGYRILPSTGGGGFKDWIQLSEHPVPSVTLETGSVSCPIPVTYYGGIWSQNCLTWAYAMEWAAVH